MSCGRSLLAARLLRRHVRDLAEMMPGAVFQLTARRPARSRSLDSRCTRPGRWAATRRGGRGGGRERVRVGKPATQLLDDVTARRSGTRPLLRATVPDRGRSRPSRSPSPEQLAGEGRVEHRDEVPCDSLTTTSLVAKSATYSAWPGAGGRSDAHQSLESAIAGPRLKRTHAALWGRPFQQRVILADAWGMSRSAEEERARRGRYMPRRHPNLNAGIDRTKHLDSIPTGLAAGEDTDMDGERPRDRRQHTTPR